MQEFKVVLEDGEVVSHACGRRSPEERVVVREEGEEDTEEETCCCSIGYQWERRLNLECSYSRPTIRKVANGAVLRVAILSSIRRCKGMFAVEYRSRRVVAIYFVSVVEHAKTTYAVQKIHPLISGGTAPAMAKLYTKLTGI